MCHSKYFRKELFRETVNAVEVQTLKIKSNELFDKNSLTTICEIFHVNADDITNIVVLKKGMTNRSYIFKCHEKRYIIRISGTGTEKLINRYQERNVYETIKGQNICDPVVYINPENGCKITEYLENSRVCDPMNESDVKRCMELLRKLHKKKLTVGHEFDIFGQIEKYQRLWGEFQSVYEDYEETKQKVYLLKNIEGCKFSCVLIWSKMNKPVRSYGSFFVLEFKVVRDMVGVNFFWVFIILLYRKNDFDFRDYSSMIVVGIICIVKRTSLFSFIR